MRERDVLGEAEVHHHRDQDQSTTRPKRTGFECCSSITGVWSRRRNPKRLIALPLRGASASKPSLPFRGRVQAAHFFFPKPRSFSVALGVFLPEQVLAARGDFVRGAGVARHVAHHRLPMRNCLVARFALLGLTRRRRRSGRDLSAGSCWAPPWRLPTACEPPLAGAEDGAPSALGPSGENTTWKRARLPTADALREEARGVAEERRDVVAVRPVPARGPAATGAHRPRRSGEVFEPSVTTGLAMNSSSALAASASCVLSGIAVRRFTVPTAKAWPSGGAALTRAFAEGRSRRKNSVVFSTNGAWKGSEWIAWRSAGVPPSIVASIDGVTVAKSAEERVEIDPAVGLRLGHRRGLHGSLVERHEQPAQSGLRRGEVVQRRDRIGQKRAQRGDRFVEPIPRPAKASPKVFEFS